MKRSKELEKERSASFHLLSLGPLNFMFQLLLLSSVYASSDLIFILSNSNIVVCIPQRAEYIKIFTFIVNASLHPSSC